MTWLVFLAGACFGAIMIALIMASVWESNERRYRNGYAGALEDARAGLIPGLTVAHKAQVLVLTARKAS